MNIALIQKNSPDGGFLQSEQWRKFQESVGNKTFGFSDENFQANIIEHKLPIVGKYFYIPRGPVVSLGSEKFSNPNLPRRQTDFQTPNKSKLLNSSEIENKIQEIIELAKKNDVGWIRIEPINKNQFEFIEESINNLGFKIKKAPHDMQPKEIFSINISGSEDEILAQMKSKTRYNIRLAKKKGVVIKVIEDKSGAEEFLRLVEITSERQGITSHSEDYYEKMLEIPNVKLYVAKFEEKVVAANIIYFFGKTATYLHGASDDSYRKVMAPFLLQWQAILDAKEKDCNRYDFGGVDTMGEKEGWAGITRFKLGFSPEAKSIEFPGTYDVVLNSWKYFLYKFLQKMKSFV